VSDSGEPSTVQRVWWIVGGVALLFAVAVVASCGDDDDQETIDVGGTDVTLENPSTDDPVEALRSVVDQLNAQAGVTEEVSECIGDEIESIPEAEIEELLNAVETLPEAEAAQRIVPLSMRLQRACVKSGTQVVGEDLDEDQIAILRESASRQLDAVLANQGLPEPVRACLQDKLGSLSGQELIEASNESFAASRQRWFRYGRQCAQP
jgi:hypothetical protein